MDWSTQQDSYSVESSHLQLAARRMKLNDGVQISKAGQIAVSAFSVSDRDFEEQQEFSYTRGRDLLAAFQKDNWIAELYWRLRQQDTTWTLLESIISLRSTKLETERIQFCVETSNKVAGFAPLPGAKDGFVNQEHQLSWFLVPHPDDLNELHLASDDRGTQVRINVPLLERGVIRRVRILLAIKDGIATENEINAIGDEFAESKIPLTT